MDNLISEKLIALGNNKFRNKFHLTGLEYKIVKEKQIEKIKKDAVDIICQRLAPAFPKNDGKQTPLKGHPVFIAQHATATCCRTCLMKWHQISRGRELSNTEIIYVVMIIIKWIIEKTDQNL